MYLNSHYTANKDSELFSIHNTQYDTAFLYIKRAMQIILYLTPQYVAVN